jgi:hypothetical protein
VRTLILLVRTARWLDEILLLDFDEFPMWSTCRRAPG